MYSKPTVEVIEFKNEEVVMNLVASSGNFPPDVPAPEVPEVRFPTPPAQPQPQPGVQPYPGGSDGLDNSANV